VFFFALPFNANCECKKSEKQICGIRDANFPPLKKALARMKVIEKGSQRAGRCGLTIRRTLSLKLHAGENFNGKRQQFFFLRATMKFTFFVCKCFFANCFSGRVML
jgi:hypothetical protein